MVRRGTKKSLLTRDALGAHVILQVVARAQVADDDAACAGAAVDELAVADIDTDVADAGAVARKEHQVAELEVGLLDIGAVVIVDAAGHTAHGIAAELVHVVDKAGAVKARGAHAAVDIRRAHVLLCRGDDGLTDGAAGLAAAVRLRGGDVGAVDIALDAVDGDSRPVAARAGDRQRRAVVIRAEDGIIRAGTGTQTHVVALDIAGLARGAAAVIRLGRGHVVLADITVPAAVADFVPVAALAGDGHLRAGVIHAEDGAGRARTRAHTHAGALDVAGLAVGPAAGDIVRADVAAHAADGDLRPAVFRAGDGQGRAVLVGTEDGVVRARAGAHAHIAALDRTVGAVRAAAVRHARERDIVRVDIAGGAVVADLVPGAVDAGDRHGRAGVVGAEDGAARARTRAHTHVAAVDRAGTEAGIHFIGAFEVIGRYVADGAVVDHRGPAAARARGHHDVGACRERGDNAVIRSGARSEVDGRRRRRTAGARRGSRNGQREREERGNNGCFQKSFRHRIILCLVIRKRAVQPHSRHIHGVVQAVLFCLFDHTVAGFQIRVGELELHGDPRRHVEVLDLFRVEDLHHNDVLVSHAAVIEQVVFPAQRMAFVAQFGRFCCQ